MAAGMARLADDAGIVAAGGQHEADVARIEQMDLIDRPPGGDMGVVRTAGGDRAGDVSEPGHPRRHFRLARREGAGQPYLAPEQWLEGTPAQEGSWWPAWIGWLQERSGAWTAPPPLGARKGRHAVLADAPGSYVHER